MSSSSTPPRRSARIANMLAPPPPSRHELARRRRAASSARPHVVVVEKPRSFDIFVPEPFDVSSRKEALQCLTVAELKTKLSACGMAARPTGNKERLIQRLIAYEIMFQNNMVIFGEDISTYSG